MAFVNCDFCNCFVLFVVSFFLNWQALWMMKLNLKIFLGTITLYQLWPLFQCPLLFEQFTSKLDSIARPIPPPSKLVLNLTEMLATCNTCDTWAHKTNYTPQLLIIFPNCPHSTLRYFSLPEASPTVTTMAEASSLFFAPYRAIPYNNRYSKEFKWERKCVWICLLTMTGSASVLSLILSSRQPSSWRLYQRG